MNSTFHKTKGHFDTHIHAWLDVLEEKAKRQSYGNKQTIFYFFKENKKYYKITQVWEGVESIHAFVDKSNGNIYKPASFSAPYKDVRYNLFDEFTELLEECDWVGRYLYKRTG